MKKQLLSVLFLLLPLAVSAQTAKQDIQVNPLKGGGVYYAYPVTESRNTPAPAGYEPFYVSHFSRHGSRYLISDGDYEHVLKTMEEAHNAGKLTALGEEQLNKLKVVMEEAHLRGGDLTPVGEDQHRGIADRMYKAFPQVFAPQAEVTAYSTVVLRCAMSMNAFTEKLKEYRPELSIRREASNRHMWYLNYHSKISDEVKNNDPVRKADYAKFVENHKVNPDRFIAQLLTDKNFLNSQQQSKLMSGFYDIALVMQDMVTPISFVELFLPEEIYEFWLLSNAHFYMGDSTYGRNNMEMIKNVVPLLHNIIDTADAYIKEGKHGASLRFAHDGNLIPLTALLKIEGCYGETSDVEEIANVFQNYYVSPMAGNVQLIFFKNNQSDVIVKVMHNEREARIPAPTDMFPFYRWADVKKFYEGEIKNLGME